MRPTGQLHLGNQHDALADWIMMQDEYDCFYFIADWHALTSRYENTDIISEYVKQMTIDWLSAGLPPERSTLFIQSYVNEHAELFLFLSMIAPLPWLERNPTYKDQTVQMSNKDLPLSAFYDTRYCRPLISSLYKAQGALIRCLKRRLHRKPPCASTTCMKRFSRSPGRF